MNKLLITLAGFAVTILILKVCRIEFEYEWEESFI